MSRWMCRTLLVLVEVVAAFLVTACVEAGEPKARDDYQYRFDDVTIPRASAEEPILPEASRQLAHRYLEQGAAAWTGQHQCVSCHTNGTYMVTRPALTASLGKPAAAMHEFFLTTLEEMLQDAPDLRDHALWPAQAIYVAAGLAEWDRHVSGHLSAETEKALGLMFEIQNERGTWGSPTCWPPYESDEYHKATVAAMAAATAPGWLPKVAATGGEPLERAIGRLKTYLRTETPPHDYGRALLLWAATRMDGLLTSERKDELVARLLRHQRADGGWSMRTLAAPEEWGAGNRAEKLQAETEFANPPSDGHMTGLAIVVLREAGVPADDERLRKGIAWLKSNQRASGRWWTRSLNTESWHFITYSGTAYALAALAATGELPRER